MSQLKATQLTRAMAIRDHVLPLVRKHGVPERFRIGESFVSATRWEHAVFTFGLWAPNQTPLRGPVDYALAVVVQDAVEQALPYGLDIWQIGVGKVLGLEWSDDGRANLIYMRPGDWDADVLALV